MCCLAIPQDQRILLPPVRKDRRALPCLVRRKPHDRSCIFSKLVPHSHCATVGACSFFAQRRLHDSHLIFAQSGLEHATNANEGRETKGNDRLYLNLAELTRSASDRSSGRGRRDSLAQLQYDNPVFSFLDYLSTLGLHESSLPRWTSEHDYELLFSRLCQAACRLVVSRRMSTRYESGGKSDLSDLLPFRPNRLPW